MHLHRKHQALWGGSAAATAGDGELQQLKEHPRGELGVELAVILFQRFSQLLH